MIDPGQAERLGRLFDGPSLPVSLAAHVRALEVGLGQAAAEYGTDPAMLRAAFVRWGFDLAPLERRPRLERSRPAPTVAPGADDLAAKLPPPTTEARVERIFLDREVLVGERLNGTVLARELGVAASAVTRALARLRRLQEQDPSLAELRTRYAEIQRMTAAELVEAAARGRVKHCDAIEVGDWWQAAACCGMDVALFFPAEGESAKIRRAKRVCAACPVRAECLRAETPALTAGRQPYGVLGGMDQGERAARRDPTQAHRPGRFLADRDLTQAAHQRASEVGLLRAAAELDTDRDTLKLAFQRWGLPAVERRFKPRRIATADQAREAHALALKVGLRNAARKLDIGTDTLRRTFRRYELAWPPPRPASPPVRRVAPVFFVLNPALVVPPRLPAAEVSARVCRQEEFDMLGPRVVYALGDENNTRPQARAWFVTGRARQAREAALASRLGAVSVAFPFPLADTGTIPAGETGTETRQASRRELDHPADRGDAGRAAA